MSFRSDVDLMSDKSGVLKKTKLLSLKIKEVIRSYKSKGEQYD
jgi:hypothetical protein